MRERILPYNKNELLLGLFVEESISTIKNVSRNTDSSFEKNDISNLINIKTYLSEESVLQYIESETGLNKVEILRLINGVVNNWLKTNIEKILENNTYWIEDALWREANSLTKILEKINKEKFSHSLFQKDIELLTCLKYKNIVTKFDDEITKYLFQNTEECIDVLLEKYEKKTNNEIYMPTKLTPIYAEGITKIEFIVAKFIDETHANDYSKMVKLRLISNSTNLSLKNELKFLAKKKYEELNDRYFQEHEEFSQTFGIASSPHIEFKEFDEKERTIFLSEKWVKENDDFKIRFIFNTSTFLELMHRGRISLDSLINPSTLTDFIFTKGKNEYPIDVFTSMFRLNVLSLMIYEKMLEKSDETVESLLSEFYNIYIVEEFGYASFKYVYDSVDMNYRSKVILLLPVFDYTLRKIEFFLKHKSLNLEYLDFDDNPVNYRTIKSAQAVKNIYLNPKNKEFPYLYLHYEPNNLFIDGKSISVFDAVKKGGIDYSKLENHDKKTIDAFIKHNCLKLEKNEQIVFVNYERAKIYRSLYFDGEIVYYDYDKEAREVIDEDIKAGLLIFDNNFLSKRESDRYSYIMDVQLYSNTLNMRNRYSHKGSINFNDSEMEHQQNYFTILMLFVQITLKFNIELCLIADLESSE